MADSPRKSSPSTSRKVGEYRPRSRSRSRSRSLPMPRSESHGRGRSKSRHRGRNEEQNPGNTLYVSGLSKWVTEKKLEEHFSKEGKVSSCFLVVDPRTRISRGFAFVSMETVEDADRCVKNLNRSVLEGWYISVQKSRRKRPRTPTPGHYLGLKSTREYSRGDRGGDPYGGGSGREKYGSHRSPSRSPYRGGGRKYSPPRGGRSRRERRYSPHGSPDRRYPRGSR